VVVVTLWLVAVELVDYCLELHRLQLEQLIP
jgi:hypothetical protein